MEHENISAHFFEHSQNLCNPFAQAGAALWVIYKCCRAEHHWHGWLCQLFQRCSRCVLLWGNHNSLENALGNVLTSLFSPPIARFNQDHAAPGAALALTSRRLKVISRLLQKLSEKAGYMSRTSSRSSRWILCKSQ